jgi:hypothetical protein
MERPIVMVYGIKRSCEGTSQATDVERAKLAQLDKILRKWFTQMSSKGK